MRIVLDTNILVRANPKVPPQGLARDLLLTIVSGAHSLVLSPAILIEVQRVLKYPRVQACWPLAPEAISQYIAFLEAASILVEIPPAFPPLVIADPNDDPILQTAVVGRADVLCSRDEHFRHKIVEEFCRTHGIRILDDILLMQELRR